MRVEPAAAEASMMLQQPEACVPCVLLGKLSLDHRTLAVAGCTGSRDPFNKGLLVVNLWDYFFSFLFFFFNLDLQRDFFSGYTSLS